MEKTCNPKEEVCFVLECESEEENCLDLNGEKIRFYKIIYKKASIIPIRTILIVCHLNAMKVKIAGKSYAV
ncbi:MAG: hypothetical protein WC472_01010 [Candidatus Paceibacterota bacterium]